MVEIRRIGPADAAQAGRTIARAFRDDPALSWAAPDAARRQRHGPRYFHLAIEKEYLAKGEVHMTADGEAAAIWVSPDRWKSSTIGSLPLLPAMLRTCGTMLPRAMSMLAQMEKRHAEQEEPHWYLPFIGTDPDHRGKGHGGALLTQMLDRCDDEGVGTYLESTGVKNQALYHRHGFETLGEMAWPKGGPPWWPMWRRPR